MGKYKELRFKYDYIANDLRPSSLEGTHVKAKNHDKIERIIGIFKRKVKESGKLLEYKERTEFEKPSAKKRRIRQKAVGRQKRQIIYDKESGE